MKQKSLILLSSCLMLSFASTLAMAKPERQHKGPPPEAFAACKDKVLGDEITFTTQNGDELKASCQYTPQNDSLLVAVPEDHVRPETNN